MYYANRILYIMYKLLLMGLSYKRVPVCISN